MCINENKANYTDKQILLNFIDKYGPIKFKSDKISDNYKAYICYAIAKSDFKDYDDAIKLYNKAIEISPNEANAFILLGNLYSNLKKFKEAEEQYKSALKINKLDPSIYVLVANVFYMNNEIERAIQSYRAAVNMRPENDEYKLVFIQVLEDYISELRKGDLVEAI